MANPIVNSLIFAGSVAGTATIQAQGIGGSATLLLPNVLPTQGQVLTASAINGFNVFLGYGGLGSISGSISVSQISAGGVPSSATFLRGDGHWATGTSGSASFDGISSGDNTSATMTVDTGPRSPTRTPGS